jgi:hypothetical protein
LPGTVEQDTPRLNQPLRVTVLGGSCNERFPPAWTIFALSLGHSMQPGRVLTFALCKDRTSGDDFLIRVIGAESTGAVDSQPLTSEQPDDLVDLYERAVEFDALDDTAGADGSTWCLDAPRGGSHILACFCTPTYDTGDRGLSGLRDLGEELWKWSGWHRGQGRML